MDPCTKPIAISKKYWDKLDRKIMSILHLCFLVSILMNVCREYTSNKLWEKLGNLYQSMFLVNKLFLSKKMYHFTMEDGFSMVAHINSFNIVISQLNIADINIEE